MGQRGIRVVGMDEITINLGNLDELVEKSDKIFLSAAGEDSLIQLLEIQEMVGDAISRAKERLVEAGARISPDFKSIHGNNIVVMYRQYGAKYQIDEANVDKLPEGLYQKKVIYSADMKNVEAWASDHGGTLPLGIIEKDRPKSIAFRLKKGAAV